MAPQTDWNMLAKNLSETLLGIGQDILDESSPELIGWAEEIARDAVEALRLGRDDLLDELEAQAILILEIKRIETTDRIRERIGAAVRGVVKTAGGLLFGGLLS